MIFTHCSLGLGERLDGTTGILGVLSFLEIFLGPITHVILSKQHSQYNILSEAR